MPDEALLNESGTKDRSASRTSGLAWLWKLLFTLLLGPVLLFSNKLPLWVVLLALGLLLAPWIMRVACKGRLIPATPINFLLLPLLLIFLPLSLWISPLFWQASWPKATSLLWSAAVFFAVVDAVPPGLTAVQHQSRLRILVAIYVAAGVFMMAVGLPAMEGVSGRLPLPGSLGDLPRLLGQSINPNEVGGIISLYLPLVVAGWAGSWTFPEQRSLLRFVIWSLLALFFGGVLLLTASFSALVGVLVGSGLVLLLMNRGTRLMFVPIGTIALLSVIIVRVSPLLDRLTLAAGLKWNSSIVTREIIWSQALHSTQDFPLIGTGLGTFRYVAPVLYPLGQEGTRDVGHAHNLFWQASLDFGLLGGLLFVMVWVVLFIYLVRSLRDIGQREEGLLIRVLTIGLLGSLVAHGLYSLFDALAPGARPGFALWYLFGLSVAVGVTAVSSQEQVWRKRVATALGMLLLFGGMVWLFWPIQHSSSETAIALLTEPQNSEDAAALAEQTAQEYCRANWHLGILENERGAMEARDAAWLELLDCSEQHTALIRSEVPRDQALAEAAVVKQPQNPAGYFWLAALEARHDVSATIAHYEQGLKLAPRDAVRWVELGIFREAAGDVNGALEAYEQGCILFDRGGNGCPRAGRLYMEAGEYDLAAERYRTSTKQSPGWLPAQRGLADALLAMGRVEEAIPYLTSLAEKGDSTAQEQLQELMQGE